MKVFALLFVLLAIAVPTFAQVDELDCGSAGFSDSVADFYMDLPPGDYTITVLGIDGFDPILGALEEDGTVVDCADDSNVDYSANLPTTGEIESSGLNAQINITNDGDDLASVAIVVGAVGTDMTGEYLLIIEGESITEDDTLDYYSIRLSPVVVSLGVPVSVYVFGAGSDLDPLVTLVNSDGDPIVDEGEEVSCDDAGSRCWLETESLEGYGLVVGDEEVEGTTFDSLMYVDWDLLGIDIDNAEGFINYQVSSFGDLTAGDYVIAFHGSIGSAESAAEIEIPADAVMLTCSQNAQSLTGETGTVIPVICPADCGGASVWGTDIYTDDSSICVAAIHAGVITSAGGAFDVTILEGQQSYPSSTQNGITTSSWGSWSRSFSVSPLGGGK